MVTLAGNVPPMTTPTNIQTGVPGVSIEQRPNGTFRVCWRALGKQPRVTVESKRTALMAAKWLGKNGKDRLADDPDLMRAIGRTPTRAADPAPSVSVKRALDDQVANATAKSQSTRASQARNLAPLFDIAVDDLTQAAVDDLFAGLKAAMAVNTWQGVASLLSMALKPYGKAALVADYAKRSRRSKRVRQPVLMTKDEMDDLVTIGHHHGIGDLLALLADLGLRYGEAVALRGTHVERIMGHPTVLVREQHPAKRGATRANPHPAPEALKSETSTRDLPPTPRVLALADLAGTSPLAADPMLGGPYRYGLALERLAAVSRDAIAKGVISRPVCFHDFRHSWGAYLLLGGVDIVTVSILMGHSSPSITGDIYGHLTRQGLDRARDLLK